MLFVTPMVWFHRVIVIAKVMWETTEWILYKVTIAKVQCECALRMRSNFVSYSP